jgi:hypothetical protein
MRHILRSRNMGRGPIGIILKNLFFVPFLRFVLELLHTGQCSMELVASAWKTMEPLMYFVEMYLTPLMPKA